MNLKKAEYTLGLMRTPPSKLKLELAEKQRDELGVQISSLREKVINLEAENIILKEVQHRSLF